MPMWAGCDLYHRLQGDASLFTLIAVYYHSSTLHMLSRATLQARSSRYKYYANDKDVKLRK